MFNRAVLLGRMGHYPDAMALFQELATRGSAMDEQIVRLSRANVTLDPYLDFSNIPLRLRE